MSAKNRFLYFLVFVCLSFRLTSQISTHDLGSWTMLFNQTRLHNKWSLHSEIQFRSYTIQPNTEQLLLRGGINFHPHQNVLLTAGYGWITNYKNDGDIFKNQTVDENRLWQQIILKDNLSRIYFEHRYRLEQRWIKQNNTTDYKNRIRYLLRMNIPINKKEITKNTLFISLYDELFIHFNKTPFDRNRLYGAIGYQLNTNTNIQLGYLLQTVAAISKQYLQVGINYNPDLRKKSN